MHRQTIRSPLADLSDEDEDIVTPSAKVFRTAPPNVDNASSKPKSRFAQQREHERRAEQTQSFSPGERFELDLDSQEPRVPLARPDPSKMLKEVQERQSKDVVAPPRPLQTTGFPQAKRRDVSKLAKPASSPSRVKKEQAVKHQQPAGQHH